MFPEQTNPLNHRYAVNAIDKVGLNLVILVLLFAPRLISLLFGCFS
jgi:hypothetical protein